MEKEKIIIKDKNRNPQMVIYSDHPYYHEIKNNIMPDEYRATMRKISNVSPQKIEVLIKNYYRRIEHPYDEITKIIVKPFVPLVLVSLRIN